MSPTSLRPIPYDLALPSGQFADATFAAIVAESEARGVDLFDPAGFLQLGEVGLALRELQGGERGKEGVEGIGALLFHFFHFSQSGRWVLSLARDAAKGLVSDPPLGIVRPWDGALPREAGYLQLPRNLFWSGPEAIDGFFWTRSTGDTLSLAAISGVVDGRPGFTIAGFPPVPLADGKGWPELHARDGGGDFSTTLPGGELGGLYSILSLGEILKLLGRVFALEGVGSMWRRAEGGASEGLSGGAMGAGDAGQQNLSDPASDDSGLSGGAIGAGDLP